MKNKLTRKLMLSAFTLLFAVISLGASTYAWFTMSKDAKVSAFQGTVGTGVSGLEICATPITGSAVKNWKSTTLNLFEEGQLGSEYLKDLAFAPVQIGNKASTFTPTFNKIDGTSSATVNKDYIAFNLHFKLSEDGDKTQTTVYLKNYKIFTESPANKWYVNHDYTKTNGDTVLAGTTLEEYYVSDAAYVALVGSSTYVLETETLKGSKDNGFASVGKQENGALNYYNAVETPDQEYPSSYLSSDFNATTKLSAQDAYPEICVLSAENYEATVTVYVWIDGWDGECLNAIFNQILQVEFDFTTQQK